MVEKARLNFSGIAIFPICPTVTMFSLCTVQLVEIVPKISRLCTSRVQLTYL